MAISHRFRLIDVFGQAPFSGNPLAVVSDAEGLDSATMLRITQWLNLSETTFLLPATTPEADYQVRIFTLDRELPFAGHPTLGSCHAWLEAGGTPRDPARIIQECGAGLVPIRHRDAGLAFAAPPLLRSGPVDRDKLDEVAAFLGIDAGAIVEARWIDNGPGWLGIMLGSAEAVLALEPARSHSSRMEVGVVGPCSRDAPTDYELRAFFSDQHGAIIEDPVTGSLNASVAQWLFETGRVEHGYVAAQGTRLGRSGRVQVERDETGEIWIGGATVTLFEGDRRF